MAERAFLVLLELAADRLHAAGDAAGAHELIGRAAGLAPDDVEVLHLCGVLHRRHGDPAKAFAQFARVLELRPDFAPTEFEVGHTCIALRQADAALRWYRKAIVSAPGFVPAYLAAARTERALGGAEAALALLDQALALEPDHAELLAERTEILDGPVTASGAAA